MSIIIALKSRGGICLCCDSRTTINGIIRDDTQKLHAIVFKDTSSIVVGRAGHDELSSRAVEIMIELARGKEVSDYRTVAETAEQAIAKLKNQLREQYIGTGEELQKHFANYEFELVICGYWNAKPYIFTLDFVLGPAVLKNADYVSMGCGWVLSDFLLKDLTVKEFDFQQALWTGIYAVEAIKEIDGRCGGATKFAMVFPQTGKGIAGMGLTPFAEDMTIEVRKFAQNERSLWKQKVEVAIKKDLARRQRRLKNDLKKNDYIIGEDEHGNPVRVTPDMIR